VDTREAVTILDGNRFFEMALGEESSLVKKINRAEGSILYFGDAMGKEYQFGDLDIERRVLQRGEIPSSFKNDITSIYTIFLKKNRCLPILASIRRITCFN